MQQRTNGRRFGLLNTFMWFLGSIGLAFFVWVIATLESDPISASTFRTIPIQLLYDDSVVVTDQSRRTVSVNVRAPQSVLEQLDSDDIEVVADLTQLGAGEHRIDLRTSVSRRADPDPSPRWVIIELEEAREQLVPVEAVISNALPAGFEIQGGAPLLETQQVLVSGPLSLVEQVATGRVTLNLQQRRNPFTEELRVVPVDVDGNTVEGVAIEPALVEVNVPVQTRSDIRQVSVIPNILLETLPEGYALSSIDYEPQAMLISGPPNALSNMQSTLFTSAIDLTGRTTTFEETATVPLPREDLFIVGPQTINISIAITPLLSSRQFEPVSVEIIGLKDGLVATLSPDEVTVLITGPQILVDALTADDIRVVIDLNGLSTGNYQIPAEVIVSADANTLTNLSVLPTEIDIEIQGGSSSATG